MTHVFGCLHGNKTAFIFNLVHVRGRQDAPLTILNVFGSHNGSAMLVGLAVMIYLIIFLSLFKYGGNAISGDFSLEE